MPHATSNNFSFVVQRRKVCRLHQLMVDGVDVDITSDDGSIGKDKTKLILLKKTQIMIGWRSISSLL
jgi:hypothetical protein